MFSAGLSANDDQAMSLYVRYCLLHMMAIIHAACATSCTNSKY